MPRRTFDTKASMPIVRAVLFACAQRCEHFSSIELAADAFASIYSYTSFDGVVRPLTAAIGSHRQSSVCISTSHSLQPFQSVLSQSIYEHDLHSLAIIALT